VRLRPQQGRPAFPAICEARVTGFTASNRASETPARSVSALLALQHLFASFNRRAELTAAEAIQELTSSISLPRSTGGQN
jgi:hypothetical protein